MRKFADLTAEDFPGVDSIEFEQWHRQEQAYNKFYNFLPLVVFGSILLFGVCIGGIIGWGLALITQIGCFCFLVPKKLKIKKTREALGHTVKQIKDALKK